MIFADLLETTAIEKCKLQRYEKSGGKSKNSPHVVLADLHTRRSSYQTPN
jgi:hypothetical protein